MNKNLTDITVVLDRSGSMRACEKEAESGLNQFIENQKRQSGQANFTLVQFDDFYEAPYRGVPINEVPYCKLLPRGNTALLDAVGRAIVETGERLSTFSEADRPGLVVFVILTDGQENASKEYTNEKIKEMITHQQDVYKWQFTYLGANQDAFAVAHAMAIPTSAAGNYNVKTAGLAFANASANVGRMRGASAQGMPVTSSYTDEERKKMNNE